MASDDDQPPSSMPLWIAVLCCGAAALLVFGNTMPAMRDRAELSQVGDELTALKHRYENAIQLARLTGARGGPTAELDLQSLFVAIDQKGYTVAEFCSAHASDDPEDAETEGSRTRR